MLSQHFCQFYVCIIGTSDYYLAEKQCILVIALGEMYGGN